MEPFAINRERLAFLRETDAVPAPEFETIQVVVYSRLADAAACPALSFSHNSSP